MADIVKGQIGNALESVAPDGIVATADAIYDETKGKSQEQINEENEDSLGAQYHNTGYYECATAAATAAKVIAGRGYQLPSTAPYGGCIKVKFAHANSAANPTLSINGSPAKPLYYDGAIASSTNTWADNETVDIYYDGTNFYANNVAGGGTFASGEKVKNVGIDSEPTAGSNNLVKSGGVDKTNKDILTKVASINKAPIVKTVTTDGTTAKDTGVTLLASHAYLVRCSCPTAESAIASSAGLYYYHNDSFVLAYGAGTAEFNAGFIAELTPSYGNALYIRTGAASDVVNIEVYDITTFEEKASKAAFDNEVTKTTNLSIDVATLNSTPFIADTTTTSSGAKNTGIRLTATHKYIIKCSCPSSDITNNAGLYNGDSILIVPITKDEFNAGFFYEYTPDTAQYLFVRTGAADTTVHTEVYDITEFKTKANKEDVIEELIINSILSDAFGFSNFQYTNGNLSSATIKWFDGTTGTMTITYSGNNISYIDYTYSSSTYRQTINYTNGEITGNQVEKL